MKTFFKYILFSSVVSLTACEKFDEINSNPEETDRVSSAMLATKIILDFANQPNLALASQPNLGLITELNFDLANKPNFDLANQPIHKSFMLPYLLNKNVVWTEFAEAYQYNGFGERSLDFRVINDAYFMSKFAESDKLAKSYEGLMYFARAIKFFEATMDLGDIPYSDALKGEDSKIYFPKYDNQKDVFIGILNELELADQSFSEGETFTGDPMYNGDVTKWRKLVNSFALNVLIQLSKKEAEGDLQVKQKFQSILSNKPIFTSNADNFQLIRSNNTGQLYPFYKVGNNFVNYPIISTEIVDRLKDGNDRRLFYYANPSPVKIAEGMTQTDFDAYIGVDPSQIYDNISRIKNTNDYSKLNNRYTELANGEPTQKLSYSQLCFIIAEASARGWVSESTVNWYTKGVEASMKFIYDNTPNEAAFHHNMPLDNTYISNYIAALDASFPVGLDDQIEKIITQKYLASFLQSSVYTYYDYRRTGYPKWKINPSTSLNSDDPTKIPVRWKYPSAEFDYNTVNVDAAVARQFDGVDVVNKVMWLLK